MKSFLIASAFAGALLPACPALAETDAPIVVTATRLPAPLDQTPAAVTIIDADDLAARYQATPRVELYARVVNIADEHYQDVFGYGEPGRAAYGGVRVRFE